MSIWTRTVAFVQNILVDSKGDMFVATADDTVGKLSVGANGTVLTADSSQVSGVAWVAPSSTGETFNPLLLIG
jgi:hypothetical protein